MPTRPNLSSHRSRNIKIQIMHFVIVIRKYFAFGQLDIPDLKKLWLFLTESFPIHFKLGLTALTNTLVMPYIPTLFCAPPRPFRIQEHLDIHKRSDQFSDYLNPRRSTELEQKGNADCVSFPSGFCCHFCDFLQVGGLTGVCQLLWLFWDDVLIFYF